MAQFTYTGEGERVYPDIVVNGAVLVAEAGGSYDLPANPDDGFWVSVSTGAPVASETPLEAPNEPATPSEDT